MEQAAERHRKLARLKATLAGMESVVVAYSGGVNSTFLVKVAHDVLRDGVLAVTARSATYPSVEMDAARQAARDLGVRHITIETDELADPKFVRNAPDRCYWCRRELFARLMSLAREHGMAHVVDGSNADDTGDFRPGMRAAWELGVRSVLSEAGLTKQDIRALSAEFGLRTWDKPSAACLASRLPYGTAVTRERLGRVHAAEMFLRSRGLGQVRVRYHGSIARIEVPQGDLPRLIDDALRKEVVLHFRSLGFSYTALDLQGYRTGSMNEVLDDAVRRGRGRPRA